MPGMDVLRRMRWGNVGRAAAVVLALTVVIAWPRLASDTQRVPTARVVPLDRGPYPARKTGAKGPTVPTGGGTDRAARREDARRRVAGQEEARRGAVRRRRDDSRRGARQRVAPREEAPQVDPPTVAGRGEKPALAGREDARGEPSRGAAPLGEPSPGTAPPGKAPPPPTEAPAPPDPDPVGAEFGFETSGR